MRKSLRKKLVGKRFGMKYNVRQKWGMFPFVFPDGQTPPREQFYDESILYGAGKRNSKESRV